MSVALPTLRVGEPVRHEALSVFPLFSGAASSVEYRLSHTALADESVLVEEVDEDGSVPHLLVENKGDTRVLFLEGEELTGAKQNRIVNTSVLVAAHTKIRIPVSCVEQGRWGYKSRYFGSSGSHSPSKLRRKLKASVARSLKEKRGHASDQGEIWKEVASMHAMHGVDSASDAMSDAFESYAGDIEAYREKLKYVEGAAGLAVAIGDKLVVMDIFDKPDTCRQVWDRLLSGIVFDSIEAGKDHPHASIADVEKHLEAAEELPWEVAEAVGEGDEFRAESEEGSHASALALEETLVHGSVAIS